MRRILQDYLRIPVYIVKERYDHQTHNEIARFHVDEFRYPVGSHVSWDGNIAPTAQLDTIYCPPVDFEIVINGEMLKILDYVHTDSVKHFKLYLDHRNIYEEIIALEQMQRQHEIDEFWSTLAGIVFDQWKKAVRERES